MCRECRALVPARVFEEDGAVYQETAVPQMRLGARAPRRDCGVVSDALGHHGALQARPAAGDAGHAKGARRIAARAPSTPMPATCRCFR